jgi:hypothetical protein
MAFPYHLRHHSCATSAPRKVKKLEFQEPSVFDNRFACVIRLIASPAGIDLHDSHGQLMGVRQQAATRKNQQKRQMP